MTGEAVWTEIWRLGQGRGWERRRTWGEDRRAGREKVEVKEVEGSEARRRVKMKER